MPTPLLVLQLPVCPKASPLLVLLLVRSLLLLLKLLHLVLQRLLAGRSRAAWPLLLLHLVLQRLLAGRSGAAWPLLLLRPAAAIAWNGLGTGGLHSPVGCYLIEQLIAARRVWCSHKTL